MQPPRIPDDEPARLRALQACALLDSPPEDRFDRLTRLARQLFDTPIALVSLVDAERQWFKSRQGLDARETPRAISFCGHTILGRGIFQITDAREDARFADNPLVTGAPHVRFYAGAPLRSVDGYCLGVLCLIDTRPRALNPDQLTALRDLADCVEREIHLHHLQRQHEALKTLTRISSLPKHDARKMLREALLLSCNYLGMPVCLINRLESAGAELQIRAVSDEHLFPEPFYPLVQSCCGQAVLADDVLVVGVSHPRVALAGRHSSSEMNYIGVPLTVEGEKYGTLSFVSLDPRGVLRCSEAEIEFVRLLGGWVSGALQHHSVQSRLKASQLELQRFFALSPMMMGIASFDGYFKQVNDAFCQVLGYARDELLRQAFIDLVHPDDRAETGQELVKLGQGQPTLSFVVRFRNHSGKYLSILWNCAPDVTTGKFYAMGLNITWQRHAEQKLLDQAQHTQAILDNMVDGMLSIDAAGIIDSVNPAFSRIFGYEPEEVVGCDLQMLLPEPYRTALNDSLARDPQTGVLHVLNQGGELEGVRKNGTQFAMELSVAEISRQGLPMYVATMRDISDRKRIERMKSEFVSTVSHELRTPLTAITGALGLIVGGVLGTLSPAVQQMIGIAYKNSQRLTFLINDLLDMEKLVAGKMQFDMAVHPLMPLIEQALDVNRPYGTARGIKLQLTDAVPDAVVMVDPLRLMQVLSNLLSNAIKFSPDNGTVEVAVNCRGPAVRITVTDHGAGVPPAFHGRIFQKFAQADASDSRQKGGTGLGLAITRELVERMTGRVGFSSVPGKDTRFFFELPLGAKE